MSNEEENLKGIVENAVKEEMTRASKRFDEKNRKKIEKELKEKGMSDDEVGHYFFVAGNETKAQEVFMSMQKMLNNLGFHLKPYIAHDENSGSLFPQLTLGTLNLERFKEIQKSVDQSKQ